MTGWRTLSPLLLPLLLSLSVSVRAGSVIAPPWVDAALNPCSSESWQLVQWPADGRCYPIFQRGPCPPSQELIWDSAGRRAVCACPTGHLEHAATARCYRRHSRGPCPRRHFFTDGAGRATCRPFGECAPGHIFWPADGQCHERLTRGPCARGELLALNPLTLEPECGCSRSGQMARSYWPHTDSCYQEYTRGPCPHGLLFVFNASRQAVECSCRPQMREHYHSDTGQCFPQQARGPCPHGNLFVFNNATGRTECRCEPGGLRLPATGACYRGYTQGACAGGQFVVPAADEPRHGVCADNPCRRGELFFPTDGRCHRVGERGPCPVGQLVHYEPYRGVSHRGACGCSARLRLNYWPEDGRCYQQLTRGPCPPQHAFVFNAASGRTECRCERRRGRAVGAGVCGAPPALQDTAAPPPTERPCPGGREPAATADGGRECRCPPGTVADRSRGRCRPAPRPLQMVRITR
ncbi:platelet endothelial aggregation receptor 1-like [Amphibalanus amphitrite]|uniref:platelet endothelial aggregation receptor 1-like n=1 Tax=Amphibalanus amphitrite TaxID=1232801 RepID=UPI001C9148C6|nr:platelet endothelial aggregation receptor 1-like [Amphibalanus amphitrite]